MADDGPEPHPDESTAVEPSPAPAHAPEPPAPAESAHESRDTFQPLLYAKMAALLFVIAF